MSGLQLSSSGSSERMSLEFRFKHSYRESVPRTGRCLQRVLHWQCSAAEGLTFIWYCYCKYWSLFSAFFMHSNTLE